MKYLKIAVLVVVAGLVTFMTGCNDRESFDFTGNLEASDQVIAQNHVFVEQVTIDRPGWIVVHEGINGTSGSIISYPTHIGTAGNFVNSFIPLDSTAVLSDGMEVVLMLYYDEGTLGVFDAEDPPVLVNDQPVTSTIILTAPNVMANDQPVENNTIVIDEIITGVRSWVAVYEIDLQGDIGNLVGFEAVNESQLTNLQVQLTDTVEYMSGDRLAAILHLNNPPVEQFVFPGNDVPLVFGFDDNNLVFDSFVIE